MTDALQSLIDRTALFDLVRRERFLRDHGRFDELADCYVAQSRVRVTWFTGTGRDFAAASRRQTQMGSRGRHLILPMSVQIKGDRALVESDGQIQARGKLHGIEVDLITDCRFYSRALRQDSDWKLVTFDCIYFKDSLAPVRPGEAIPIDWERLAKARLSYRFIDYFLGSAGHSIDQDLAGDDRPDLIAQLYAEGEAWLDA